MTFQPGAATAPLFLQTKEGHAFFPSEFSSASMAIKDGVTFATLLSSDSADETPNRLKLYGEIRTPRAGRIRDTARTIAKWLEDRQLLEVYHGFLKEHDAVEYEKKIRRNT
jgi:hypothetical protein